MWDEFSQSMRASRRLELGKLRVVVPMRLALGVITPLAVGLLVGEASLGVVAAIGAFIAGVSDGADVYPVRVRAMGATTLTLTLVTLVGSLVSESDLLTVLVSIPVAAMCGYAAALGPRAGVAGVLALVMFTLCAGGPIGPDGAIERMVAVLVGGGFQTALALAGWPFRRIAGVRGEIADAWRTFAVAAGGPPVGMLSPTLPNQLVVTTGGIAAAAVDGESRKWFVELVENLEQARLPMASLAAIRHELAEQAASTDATTALDEFSAVVGRFARRVARALVLPHRRLRVQPAFAQVLVTAAAASQAAPQQVGAVVAALRRTNDSMSRPFPIGRRAQIGEYGKWCGFWRLLIGALRNTA